MKLNTYGRVINKNSKTFIGSMNVTSIYIMHTCDLCNDFYQKTMFNQNLKSGKAMVWINESSTYIGVSST